MRRTGSAADQPTSTPESERLEGTPSLVVGRYALYGEIARGGMATVYFARLHGAAGFARPVAIKRMHPHSAHDPAFTKMFIDEARLASRISHPNVVPTLDVVACDGELMLVMEYVRGESLAKLLRRARERRVQVPIRVALAIMSNVLHGLHAAHEAQSEDGAPLSIVHRDVSPQNILVGVDGVARVLDFGIARAAERLEHTENGRLKGKLAYMAPEQIAGKDIDRRADLYSAAVVMWELLTGQRLYKHGALDRMCDMQPRVERPSLERPEIPDALDGIVLHGLEPDPSHRFGTAREMALALEQFGSLATPSEVGAWVEQIADEALSERQIKVAKFESGSRPAVGTQGGTRLLTDVESAPPVTVDVDEPEIMPAAGPAPAPAPESSREEITAPSAPRPPRRFRLALATLVLALVASVPFAMTFPRTRAMLGLEDAASRTAGVRAPDEPPAPVIGPVPLAFHAVRDAGAPKLPDKPPPK
jgi:serine/threonine-protein kinase